MNSVFSVELFYAAVGLIFAGVALRACRNPAQPRRAGTALFWGLLAAIFLGGTRLPPVVAGYAVLALVALAALRLTGSPTAGGVPREVRAAAAARLGNRLFLPALLVPGTAVAGALLLGKIHLSGWWLLDHQQTTLAALGLGSILALLAGLHVTRAGATVPLREGGRLLQTMGWALILPQMLAALGGVLAKAGAGTVVADLVARALPTQFPFVAVVAYCLGMAVFTMCLGNAFAAFPVITLGIGLPFIVRQHHGSVAIMAAIGMLSGYCGTLMTPMAANFNLVPAMLLELRDRHAVIKAQVPIGLAVLTANILLMYFCVYRF